MTVWTGSLVLRFRTSLITHLLRFIISSAIHLYDAIIYTVVLGKSIQSTDTTQNSTHLIREELAVVYDSGLDYIALKP